MANENRIRHTIAAIEADPQHWDQGDYVAVKDCGTTFCMAGWACKLAGHDVEALYDNPDESVHDTAQEWLGLTEREADKIFLFTWVDNEERRPTLDELKCRVTEVTGVTFPERGHG